MIITLISAAFDNFPVEFFAFLSFIQLNQFLPLEQWAVNYNNDSGFLWFVHYFNEGYNLGLITSK